MVRLLKKALEGILTASEVSQLYSSFDVVGDIAVIKIPEALREKESVIGRAILENVKSVKTVLKQVSPVSGDLRVRGLKVIAGEDRASTIYKEHGCRFKIDLSKVYFTPRLSEERLRVASLVKPSETVLNMFAGVGSFSIIIVRKQPSVKVYSIDINPEAHRLALENVKLNKVYSKVLPILGDAREVIMTSLRGVADRVLMPLPERAQEFLDAAVAAVKPEGGVIHYYTHVHISKGENGLRKAEEQVQSRLKVKHNILFSRVVREVGPRLSQIVVDIMLS